MKFIADFHIHSHFSIATSKKLVPEHLEYWARLKGINVIGTGDCIHPGWQRELAEKLEPCGNGMFKLKSEYRLEESKRLKHEFIPDEVYFILTGEISNIYKRGGKVRKVHNVCVFPDMQSLLKVQSRLDDIGNITSDGRPILGLDSRVLLDMVLESSPESFVIPAHIWTPWFSALGSKSGFDSIGECYGDLTKEIFAVETGLSSDPAMNWRCSFLDKFRLVSNSDAHSPEKLGREANLFDTELSYSAIYNSLKYDKGFTGTVEFYPEEGKYHYDGHRNCGVVWNPLETIRHDRVCPVCGKEVTVGVMYRVAELGDRNDAPDSVKKEFYSITRLPDLLSEVMRQKNSSSKNVMNEYMKLVRELGSEFHIYLESDTEDIISAGGEILGEGIRRLRSGEVHVAGGYDGEFGVIKVFDEGELDSYRSSSLFSDSPRDGVKDSAVRKRTIDFDVQEFKRLAALKKNRVEENPHPAADNEVQHGLTGEQSEAAFYVNGPCVVIAGPGAGKTHILAERIRNLMAEGVAPAEIAALTFSNRAADELRSRTGEDAVRGGVTVSTLHSLGLSIIKENPEAFNLKDGFVILDDDERLDALKSAAGIGGVKASAALKKISAKKQGIESDADAEIFKKYNNYLVSHNSVDVDDLIYLTCIMLENNEILREQHGNKFSHILVDEFQDINSIQYRFIRFFAPREDSNLFVIGDPDQAIYGFRGADPKFMLGLAADYPGLKTFKLSRSFRCSGIILKAAGQALGKGEYLAGGSGGVKVVINEFQSDRSEADWIASEIERLVGGVRSFSMDSGISDGVNSGAGFGDFAVLCRSSFMFDALVEGFTNHGIAYQVIGTEPFYESEPYHAVFSRIRAAMRKSAAGDEVSDAVIRSMMHESLPVYEMIIRLLIESGNTFDEWKVKSAFGGITGYNEFLRALPMRKGADDYRPDFEAVSIITIHSAKGLEFNTVFIPGCEEGILPFNLFGKDMSDINEEERIFYVGITRAKERVYLTHAAKREFKGRMLQLKRSGFLDRIEKDIIEKLKREPQKKKEDDLQMKLF